MVMINHTKEECETKINVTKTLTGENICYSFIPKDFLKYHVGDISTSVNYGFEVYALIFNTFMYSRVRQITIITHFVRDKSKNPTPWKSRQFGKKVNRVEGDNILRVSSYYLVYLLLPPPADTQCFQGFDQGQCLNNCLSAALEKVNRYPWSVFIEEGSQKNMSILSQFDLKQQSMQNAFSRAKKDCSYCRGKLGCITKVVHSQLLVFSERMDGITLSSMTPMDSKSTIEAVQNMTLVEFFSQVASSFGIWFGISIFSANPTNWIIMRRKKKVRQTLRRRQCMKPHGALFFKASTLESKLNLRSRRFYH
jgi:hypothetical protein